MFSSDYFLIRLPISESSDSFTYLLFRFVRDSSLFVTMLPKPKISWLVKDSTWNDDLVPLRNNYTWISGCLRGERNVVLHVPRDQPNRILPEDDRIERELNLFPGGSLGSKQNVPFWYSEWVPEDIMQEKRDMTEEVMSKSLETGFRGFRLHWKKIVGQGGFGLITLWEAEFEDGHREDIIIKMGLHADMDFFEESSWHDRYSMASRIVQTRDLAAMATQHQRAKRFARGQVFSANQEKVLVMENMRLGSLYSILQKAAIIQRHFPSNALWQLWESCKYPRSSEFFAAQRGFVYTSRLLISPFILDSGPRRCRGCVSESCARPVWQKLLRHASEGH